MAIVKARLSIIYASGLFLILIDQTLKNLARNNADFSYYLWRPWVGWEYFSNLGVAFGLPVPQSILIFITPLIIFTLAFFALEKNRPLRFHIALALIIAGAVSNFIDRVIFERTIDYLRLLTGVINLADIAILVGAVLLLRRTRSVHEPIDPITKAVS